MGKEIAMSFGFVWGVFGGRIAEDRVSFAPRRVGYGLYFHRGGRVKVEVEGGKRRAVIRGCTAAAAEAAESVKREYEVVEGNAKPGIIVLGPPGSGKTLLCERLSLRFGLVHVSVNDILRAHVKHHSEIGERAEQFLQRGESVPDDVISAVIHQRIRMHDCQEKGFILDGIPQNS